MNSKTSYVLRGKCIITISIVLLVASIGLMTFNMSTDQGEYSFLYEQVNVNNIATAVVPIKKDSTNKIITKLLLTETPYKVEKKTETKTEIFNIFQEVPKVEDAKPVVAPKRHWYLPTEQGIITQYPRYNHVALDITSSRGVYEAIYPVAEGVISGIYRDYAGALIVTVRHNIEGKVYTSQYVHLSSYAPGLYVGKYVSVYDRLGQMGSTGISTGVHLHLAVIDCSLYADNACPELGNFYNYANYRLGQGFYGLQNLMYVPHTWYGR